MLTESIPDRPLHLGRTESGVPGYFDRGGWLVWPLTAEELDRPPQDHQRTLSRLRLGYLEEEE